MIRKLLSRAIWALPIHESARAALDEPRAFVLGVYDGVIAARETDESYIGRTWDKSQDANEAYDSGANVGQIVGGALVHWTALPTH